METQKPNVWRYGMNYGLVIGLVLVLYAVFLYILNLTMSQAAGSLTWILYIGGVIYCTLAYRKMLGGYISYGQAVGISAVSMIFAGLLYGAFTYVQTTLIDPELINKMLTMIEEKMIEKGIPESQIEMGLNMQRKFMTPVIMGISSVFTVAIMGTICSLVTSIFLKKTDPNAQNA